MVLFTCIRFAYHYESGLQNDAHPATHGLPSHVPYPHSIAQYKQILHKSTTHDHAAYPCLVYLRMQLGSGLGLGLGSRLGLGSSYSLVLILGFNQG